MLPIVYDLGLGILTRDERKFFDLVPIDHLEPALFISLKNEPPRLIKITERGTVHAQFAMTGNQGISICLTDRAWEALVRAF